MNEIIIEENSNSQYLGISVKPIIERLLTIVPQEYLQGLHKIIITNSGCLNHKMRRKKTLARGKKYTLSECRGWYSYKTHTSPASIELLADNILCYVPKAIVKLKFIQDIFFAEVLFHEIGHHIHYAHAPEHKERETVANAWERKFSKKYFLKTYWYVFYPLLPFLSIAGFFMRIAKKISCIIRGNK